MISALGDRLDFPVVWAGFVASWLNYLAGVDHDSCGGLSQKARGRYSQMGPVFANGTSNVGRGRKELSGGKVRGGLICKRLKDPLIATLTVYVMFCAS
jgi:hypothetical protein